MSATAGPNSGRDGAPPQVRDALTRYWRANLRLTVALLAVWAAAGLGLGVLFADALGGLRLFGFPLGFWVAQQGAILVFVVLILVYALALDRLDAAHHREIEAASREPER